MSEVLDAPGPLSDDELDRRLRTTYARVAAMTRLTRGAHESTMSRPSRLLRVPIALASVVLLVGLGVLVAQRRDDVAGRGEGPRWALVQLFQWGLLEVRPYDATVDGLGPQRGDVVRYGRGDAVLSVMSLRDATIDGDRLIDDVVSGAPSVLATPDGRLAVRRMSGDLTLVVRMVGDTDAEHAPDLVQLARSVVTVGEAAWARARQRQGFAFLGPNEPPMVVDLGDGVEIERVVIGSLRSGASAAYRTGVITYIGVAAVSEDPRVDLFGAADRPIVLRASPTVASVAIDGADVALTPVTDTDSGVTVGWAAVRLEAGTRVVVGRDAAGTVVSEDRVSVPPTDGGELP